MTYFETRLEYSQQPTNSFKLPSFGELTKHLNCKDIDVTNGGKTVLGYPCEVVCQETYPQDFQFPRKMPEKSVKSSTTVDSNCKPQEIIVLNSLGYVLHQCRKIHRLMFELDCEFQSLLRTSKPPGLEFLPYGNLHFILKLDFRYFVKRMPLDTLKQDLPQFISIFKQVEQFRGGCWWSQPPEVVNKDLTAAPIKKKSIDPKPKGPTMFFHRKVESSPGRMQQTGKCSRKHLKQRGSTMSICTRSSRRQSISGPSGDLVDINIDANKLVASVDAIASVQNPVTTPSCGLHNELSVAAKPLKCRHCGSEKSPEWRRGPEGKQTLCNACGLFFSKLARKYGPGRAAEIMKERRLVANPHRGCKY
ncbi:hypothetical protein CAAN1_07S02498 [[Candida] anglica]|uniref:GATA-type domain-containing protein n=1 Tax=[Candida] anglica TaxID=148631 RepID=A0ABP0ECW0_9ASCO